MIEIEERVTLLLTTRAAVLSLRLLLLLLSRLLQPPMIENNYDIDSTKNYTTRAGTEVQYCLPFFIKIIILIF